MLKVFENPDLRIQIVSYSGINIKKRCWVCDEPIKYNNFLKSHDNIYRKIFDYGSCKYIYLCDNLCYLIYVTHFKYKRGLVYYTSCISIIFISVLLLLFYITRLGL